MIPVIELLLKERFPLLKLPNFHHLIHLFYRSVFSDTSVLKSNIQFTLPNFEKHVMLRAEEKVTYHYPYREKKLKMSYLLVFKSKGKKLR